jgi:hypothetical protein
VNHPRLRSSFLQQSPDLAATNFPARFYRVRLLP